MIKPSTIVSFGTLAAATLFISSCAKEPSKERSSTADWAITAANKEYTAKQYQGLANIFNRYKDLQIGFPSTFQDVCSTYKLIQYDFETSGLNFEDLDLSKRKTRIEMRDEVRKTILLDARKLFDVASNSVLAAGSVANDLECAGYGYADLDVSGKKTSSEMRNELNARLQRAVESDSPNP